MRYISTRGSAPELGFDGVLLAGLARDGGLYVPDAWPAVAAADIEALKGLPYPEVALRLIRPYVANAVSDAALAGIVDKAYASFDTPDVAPMVEIGDNEWLLELFHGPTLAFKDMALQFLGPVFDHVLKQKGEWVTIVGATSGDTGSAAIEACRDRDAIEIFMLHPRGRVSDVQRRQMTTVQSANVHNIAIDGTFDDCQNLVKGLFNDAPFRDRYRLSAVNSINWARIAAQIVYYFWAAAKLGAPAKPVSFAVPTGNFGNVFAGYAARASGLDIAQLIVGSNKNDILTRFFETGVMATGAVHPTLSPSMDIQVSSNFERLLFDLVGRDGAKVAKIMETFKSTGRFELERDTLARATALFSGARFDDEETKATIKQVHDATGILVDPHTAVGIAAGRKMRRDKAVPLVALATAHPAKFPDAITAATGKTPNVPERLRGVMEKEERCRDLGNDLEALKAHITEHAKQGEAA